MKNDLRIQLRKKRQALSSSDKKTFSKQILTHLPKLTLNTSQNIGIYLSTEDELSTAPLIEELLSKNIKLYVPVLHPILKRTLWFQEYTSTTETCLNKFQIKEPVFDSRKIIAPWELDIVIMPLMAFDHQGNRLGMGGGFYDTSFRFNSAHKISRFIGLAYDFQRIENCPTEPWDIKLNGVLTPEYFKLF
ncbi:5-formyltetrahydrofolate cyclo-ligase [Francisellaceae bacterium]|nr:5-formyltetrahydrofolate cyclo-ligase [Francisellaceae bacterium]